MVYSNGSKPELLRGVHQDHEGQGAEGDGVGVLGKLGTGDPCGEVSLLSREKPLTKQLTDEGVGGCGKWSPHA